MRPPDVPSSGEAKPVRITLLGGFGVSVGACPVREDDWRLRKACDLVKLLALAPDHRLHRERVSYLLWPTLARDAAANNLRQAVHAARRALGGSGRTPIPAGYLTLEGELLALCPRSALWVDADAFEAAAAAARRSRDPAAYGAALNLYAGDLLPADLYEEWAEERRERLRQDRLSLLLEVAELREGEGDLKAAEEALRAVVTDEPAHEEAQVRLMRLYANTGQRYQALRQYETLREELRLRFGAEPGAAGRRLSEEIAGGEVSVAGGLRQARPSRGRPPSTPKHNIPAALSSFVGREREMVEVQRSLAMTRLLTLTGAGGTGKTRLATEAARELAGAYPDGAWMVDASALSDPQLLTRAAAAAFGVREQPEQPLITSLADALRPKETLLVLDNCEHLIDACAHLSETLLGSCRGLRILATSRQALGIAGEMVWPVPPLSVPDPGRPATVEEVASSEAALLFSDRARHRRPDFALGPENARAVAEICRRLDGMPLAVELAAARAGVLGVGEVAERLKDALGLLTGGSRTAAPRQRTLRATLRWSHDLLDAPERRLFARLSVFAGGWTLEAAEAVGRAGEGDDGVLEGLSGLVDKSLVAAEAAGAGAVRYGMLEPVRQYARERLEASDEADAALGRHAEYFLEQAEAARSGMFGPRQQRWLDRLEREHDNLRAALGWLLERRDGRCLRLGVALSRFWYTRGYLGEGRRWLEEGLARAGPAVPAPALAEALGEAGWLAEAQGDYARARAALEAGLDVYRAVGHERGIATCLRYLGSVAWSLGEYGEALGLLEESLDLLRRSGTDADVLRVLTSLGILAVSQDGPADAEARFEEALSLARKIGDVRGAAVSLNNLGHVSLLRGDAGRATAAFEEALEKDREVGEAQGTAVSLINLALAALAGGDHPRAGRLLQESLTLLRDVGNREVVAECLEAMAAAAASASQARRAGRLWGAAEGIREALGAPLPGDELAMLEPHLAAARSGAEGAWEGAGAEGRAMTYEDAVEYALSEEPPEDTAPERQAAPARPGALTRREREVAALVADGLTNRQIASKLGISEHTAATHLRRSLKKLDLGSRSQLASWVTARATSAPT